MFKVKEEKAKKNQTTREFYSSLNFYQNIILSRSNKRFNVF